MKRKFQIQIIIPIVHGCTRFIFRVLAERLASNPAIKRPCGTSLIITYASFFVPVFCLPSGLASSCFLCRGTALPLIPPRVASSLQLGTQTVVCLLTDALGSPHV
jgi:hypothetical protein